MFRENKSDPFFFRPEVEHLSRIERDQLWMRCIERRTKRILWPTVLFIAVIITFFVSTHFEMAAFWDMARIIALILVCIPLIWADRRYSRDQLQEQLRADGIRPARCFRCKYDLRGSESTECPECGELLIAASKAAHKAEAK